MSFIELGKQDSPKNLNIKNTKTPIEDFRISHENYDDTVFDKDLGQSNNNIGLDFLTGNSNADEESQEEESEQGDGDSCDNVMGEKYTNLLDNGDPEVSFKELQQKKAFAMYNLNRYKKMGYPLSRNFGSNHTLEELEDEVFRIETEKNLDNGLKHCKDAMLAFTKGVETVNNMYGEKYIKLNGWSEFILTQYNDHVYDDVFIKLWQKYSGKLPDYPEFTLLFLLGMSAFTFHMARLQAEKQSKPERQTMKQPSFSYEDLDNELNASDTSSNASDESKASSIEIGSLANEKITINIPDAKDKPAAKKRGRPKKAASVTV